MFNPLYLGSLVLLLTSPAAAQAAPPPSPAVHNNQGPAAATAKRFPPPLVLKEAAAWKLEDTDALAATAKRKPVCRKLQQRYIAMVREAERVVRMPNEDIFMREAVALQQRTAKLDEPACPEMHDQLKLLQAYLEEHKALYPSMQAANLDKAFVPAKTTRRSQMDLRAQFNELNDNACARAALTEQISAKVWCHGAGSDDVSARRQRYLLNLSCDAALVHRDGSVGGACSDEQFLALVETSNESREGRHTAVLQGQGPVEPEDIARYLDAATHYAERQGIGHVLFVNAAEGDAQVPSFAAQVGKQPHRTELTLEYIGTATWADGGLVKPADAAALANKIVDQMRAAQNGALLVVNCNAGLDRSGILNVLVQLVGETRRQYVKTQDRDQLLRFGYALIPQLVGSIKRARPHSISSPARYIFIHQAFEAYVAELTKT